MRARTIAPRPCWRRSAPERAESLPPELYWRADVYALELERIAVEPGQEDRGQRFGRRARGEHSGRDELETTAFLLSGSGDDESLVETAAIRANILLERAPIVDELVEQIRACPTQVGIDERETALAGKSG